MPQRRLLRPDVRAFLSQNLFLASSPLGIRAVYRYRKAISPCTQLMVTDMNILRKLLTIQEPTGEHQVDPMASEQSSAVLPEASSGQGNVISLPVPELSRVTQGATTPAKPMVGGRLIGSDLVKAFFDQNHFGLGRHNGTNYRTIDAMEFGRSGRIAEFTNAIRETIDRMQAKIDRLESTQIEAAGVCKATSAKLGLAISQLERDIAALKEQSDLAAESKGWVLEALNRYQAGFVKGVREAVEAELILG